jgi:hypothetical protein
MTIPLNQALISAHDTGDVEALIGLYQQAAREAVSDDAKGFFLTHAYVFALERGDQRAASIRQELISMGRDTPPACVHAGAKAPAL